MTRSRSSSQVSGTGSAARIVVFRTNSTYVLEGQWRHEPIVQAAQAVYVVAGLFDLFNYAQKVFQQIMTECPQMDLRMTENEARQRSGRHGRHVLLQLVVQLLRADLIISSLLHD